MTESETIPPVSLEAALSGAHWTIYLPTLTVAATWAVVFLWAEWREPPLAAIRSIALAVEAVVVPVLFVHAFLRARVLRAEAADGEVHLRWGFPFRRELTLPAGQVALAQARQSWAQRFLGGGALALIERSGRRHLVADLARPEEIAALINETNRRKDAA